MLRPEINHDYEWTWVSVSKTNLSKQFIGLTKKEAWKCASNLSALIKKENKADKKD